MIVLYFLGENQKFGVLDYKFSRSYKYKVIVLKFNVYLGFKEGQNIVEGQEVKDFMCFALFSLYLFYCFFRMEENILMEKVGILGYLEFKFKDVCF